MCWCSNRTCLNPILPVIPDKIPSHSAVSVSQSTDQTATLGSKVKRVVKRKSYLAMLSGDNEELKQSAAEPDASQPGVGAIPDGAQMKSRLSGRLRGHRLFGTKKFTTKSSSSLSKLKHKVDRGSGEASWKRQTDPWKKRRSLLASDRTSTGIHRTPTRSPRNSPRKTASPLHKLKPKVDRESGDAPWRRQNDPWKKRRSLLVSDRTSTGLHRTPTRSPRRVASSSSLASLSDSDASRHSSSQSRNLLKVELLFQLLIY